MASRRAEALSLAEELLADIELRRVAPPDVARKTYRLARLLDDDEAMEWLRRLCYRIVWLNPHAGPGKHRGAAKDFVPSTLSVRSDRRLLRRLLQNLVSNAVKYTPQGRVLIGCRRRQGRLRIDVYDTGLGIPQSKKRAIFKEFHRLDQGAKVARGLGLGLSIVERIARVLDHKIELRSKPGQGSHFSVEAPLAPALPSDARARAPQRVDVSQLAGMLVLCVDNEPKILDGMETLLGGWGCRVLKAPDLKSALAAIADPEDKAIVEATFRRVPRP